MDLEMPRAAVEFGSVVARAIESAGGVELARRAEVSREDTRSDVERLLSGLGALELRAGEGGEELAAACELARVAGSYVLPFPLVPYLAGRDGRPLVVIDPDCPVIEHGDVAGSWMVVDLDGARWTVTGTSGPAHRLAPMASLVEVQHDGEADGSQVPAACFLALEGWRVLGALERAMEMVIRHVKERQQFGRPLAAFQAIRFQVADIAVAVRGLQRLAQFTAWRLHTAGSRAWGDVFALRLATQDRADGILRSSHQILGAIGFCDEHDLSVLDRHIQAPVRLPLTNGATIARLDAAIRSDGFDGLYDGVGSAWGSAS